MYPALTQYLQSLDSDIEAIPESRLPLLQKIAAYCQQKLKEGLSCDLTFICTHNSRRSHLGQIWAKAIASVHHVDLRSWSGGTEATAFNPNAIQALRDAGFEITQQTAGSNPHYLVKYSEEAPALEAWSKVFSDPANPQKGFGAVMTCQEADEACPFVPGAEMRVALSYEDPKAFDGTPQQAEMYSKRCRQIAAEMWYVFANLDA